tara:strand:- start:10215 stop:11690 length:1476 start_codon:yes stop_codon:yes gene_type:complete
MVDDIAINPSGTIPLATLTLNLGDLVNDVDSTIVVDPDNSLRIYYRQDSVFTYSASDILTIPDQDPFELAVSKAQPFFRVGVALGTIAGAQLGGATFSDGTVGMEIAASDSAQSDIRFKLTFYNATLNGQTYSDTFTLDALQRTLSDSSLISGLSFDFSDGGTRVNFLDIGIRVLDDDTAALPDNVVYSCGVALRNLGLEVASGYFGQRVQAAPAGNFNFDVNGIANFAGGLFLTNPNVTLITKSTVGLPIQITTDFDGENSERTRVSLDAPPFNILASPGPGIVQESRFTLNANNSQITNFLANIPETILYAGDISLNPDGNVGPPNFIASTSNVVIDFEVDVPMEMRMEDMRLDQTIEDFSISAGGNEDFFEKLTLYFNSENGLPLDLNLRVVMQDSVTSDSIAGFQIGLLNAAPVDNNGRVIAPAIADNEVVFDQTLISALLRSGSLRFIAEVNSTNNGQDAVKMYSDYELVIRSAIEANSNIKVNSL